MQKAGNGIQVFRQESGMDENERQAFLENFREGTHETVLGFCVLGLSLIHIYFQPSGMAEGWTDRGES